MCRDCKPGKKPKKGKAGKDTSGNVAKFPKKKCCESRTKCSRCPLRMLQEGTLPAGYTVKRRRLVKLDHVEVTVKDAPVKVSKKKASVEALACASTKKKLKKAKKSKKAA